MNITKKILTFSSLFVLLLTGCDGDGRTKVVFWHTMGASNKALLDDMIAEFAALHPDINVTHASQGGYPEIRDKISSAIPAGTTPTMAFCYPDHVANYIKSGAIEDMTPYLTDEEIGFVEAEGSHLEGEVVKSGVDDFVPGYWGEGLEYQVDGLYSVPFSKSTEALFYNVDFFNAHSLEVPTTWTEMLALCRTIKAIAPTKIPLGYDSDSNLFITLCEQMGIPYTAQDSNNHFLFDNADAKDLVTQLKAFYDEGLFITKGVSPNSSYTSTKFTDGTILMSIGSTGGTSYNFSPNFEVGVAVPPAIDAEEPAVISQGPSITFFKRAKMAEKRAAWEFYKFISNSENSARYSILTGYEPVRISSYETAEYRAHLNATGADANLFTKVANVTINMRDSYFYSPVFVGSSKARDVVGGIIASVLLELKTIDKAFEDAITECIFASGV
ncbi:MAG: extracellular solute-binding protein [Bacilli bacterium]|jgi:multiple sugar transport system substrate-binding protein